jgi:carbon-monoxide dehydrogenase small subunit
MPRIALSVNGRRVTGEVENRTLLVDFIRNHLHLTGTHIGCDTSQCGCCIVHVDGLAVKSCSVLAVQVDGSQVTTIEGLSNADEPLHPMQEAFRQCHALQCGFCTPGMIMAALDMVRRNGHDLNEALIRRELKGNLCRCTGYQNIVAAIRMGARSMAETPVAETPAKVAAHV